MRLLEQLEIDIAEKLNTDIIFWGRVYDRFNPTFYEILKTIKNDMLENRKLIG